MADIPKALVDTIMVKCGRRCCICRRFLPTKLQVHHIVERSNGGTDDEDNLMPICLTCHSDVHSKVPFARRFSTEELKGHRDALFQMVAAAVFPAEPDNTAEVNRQIVVKLAADPKTEGALSPTAVRLLLAAAHETGNRQGRIFISSGTRAGREITAGNQSACDAKNVREVAEILAAIQELEDGQLIEYHTDSVRVVTHAGYLRADEIAAEHGR